jgi:hypothetical protein
MKKTIFVFMLFSFVFIPTLEPFVVMNDIVPVFSVGEQDKIESSIIDGAVRFLQAKSYADLLLREYETSGKQSIHYPAALEYAEKAMSELQTSKSDYMKAIEAGTRAGYAVEIVDKFKAYDYDMLAAKKGLNKDIMSSAKTFLSSGDILGAYRKNVNNIDNIISTLQLIKEKLAVDVTPDISLFWQLLQQFSTAALFGNYCTMTAAAVL